MGKLYIVGIGPGSIENMTLRAIEAIKKAEVVVGYKFYIELIEELLKGKEVYQNGMRAEIDRCKKAIEFTKSGKNVAIISTGDPGLYGMAGPIYQLAENENIDIEVIPGVSSVFSAASELGAAIMHDLCTISLSDLLTPWETIEKRIEKASEADFIIALYNPRSKSRKKQIEKAFEIMGKYKSIDTPVGIVKNSGREKREIEVTKMGKIVFDNIDMKTIVIVGNKETYIKNGKIITPRGYSL